MDKYIIQGGKPLYGEVNIGGMKNSALPIIYATINYIAGKLLLQIKKHNKISHRQPAN